MGRTPTSEDALLKLTKLIHGESLEKRTILLEAYKKHATELTNVEDRQHKLTLLILGIFGAGATLIGSGHVCITSPLKWALMLSPLAIVTPSWKYVSELHTHRRATRELLVRCEIALGIHTEDVFLKGEKLYTASEIRYGEKGDWLPNTYYLITAAVWVAFMLIVYLAAK